MERRGFAALHGWKALRAGREAVLGPIVYRLGRHPFTVQRGVRFPLGLLQNGLIDTQSVTRQVRGEKGVSDPDSSSWGRSSVWLEHSTVTREVAGSNPVAPVSDSSQVTQLRVLVL